MEIVVVVDKGILTSHSVRKQSIFVGAKIHDTYTLIICMRDRCVPFYVFGGNECL